MSDTFIMTAVRSLAHLVIPLGDGLPNGLQHGLVLLHRSDDSALDELQFWRDNSA